MTTTSEAVNRRVLVVDDNPSIHSDFAKILAPVTESSARLQNLLAGLMADEDRKVATAIPAATVVFELQFADQGETAHRMVAAAEQAGRSFAVAFVDVRMPPGWDGIQTITRLWDAAPHMEMVICTAYSDYSWEDILAQLGTTDQLQFLRKPFDVVSVKQMALALTTKWNLAREVRRQVDDLERAVTERTRTLNDKVRELERAASEISQLRGILPMCMYCHKIRDDRNYWQAVDNYIRTHSLAEISHGICPECYRQIVEPLVDAEAAKSKANPSL